MLFVRFGVGQRKNLGQLPGPMSTCLRLPTPFMGTEVHLGKLSSRNARRQFPLATATELGSMCDEQRFTKFRYRKLLI